MMIMMLMIMNDDELDYDDDADVWLLNCDSIPQSDETYSSESSSEYIRRYHTRKGEYFDDILLKNILNLQFFFFPNYDIWSREMST